MSKLTAIAGIYPNPFSDQVWIEYSINEPCPVIGSGTEYDGTTGNNTGKYQT